MDKVKHFKGLLKLHYGLRCDELARSKIGNKRTVIVVIRVERSDWIGVLFSR